MADYRTETSVGRRIAAARKDRGFRTPKDLANALPGTNVSAAVIENIEAGRKANLDISQLLNIAWALHLPPGYLLAPMAQPGSPIDLPNLTDDLRHMTVAEFDAWVSGTSGGAYRARHAQERADVARLNALREYELLSRDLARLRTLQNVEDESDDPALIAHARALQARLDHGEQSRTALAQELASEGFMVTSPKDQ